MPIYPYRCEECEKEWDEICAFAEKPDECPSCGETANLKRLLGLPQRPKIQGKDSTQNWGYNKTTTDYLFDGEGRRMAHQYDENKQKSQIKEFARKEERKGATISVTKPKTKVPTKK